MVILVSSRLADLVPVVQNAGHCVVFKTNQLAQIILPLLEFSPHIVFVESPLLEEQQFLRELEEKFRSTRFVRIEAKVNPIKVLTEELAKPPLPAPKHTYVPAQRQLLLDSRYAPVLSNKPPRTDISNPSHNMDLQELRLTWLVRTARQNRARAKEYQHTLAALEENEFEEIGFRAITGDFHSVIYARSQIGKYLGHLAHGVAGADLDALPLAADPCPEFRFVEYAASLRLLYALHLLSLFGFAEDLYADVITQLDWCYTGQPRDEIDFIGRNWFGTLLILRAVCQAQAHALDWLLHRKTSQLLDLPVPRSLHRARQIFSAFWGFEQVLNNPIRLQKLLNKLSAEISQPDLPEELEPPSFLAFYQMVCSSDPKGSNPTS